MWWHDIKEIKNKVIEIDYFLQSLQEANNAAEIKALDKFEDFMRNIDKLNTMINEFKGCVAMARSVVSDKKEQQKDFEDLKEVAKISKKIYESMQSFIDAGESLERKNYFKLDAIYRKVCEIEEENPKKKGKSRKKKASPSL